MRGVARREILDSEELAVTLKLLFDCVLTAEPAKCSTNIQFWHFANRVLEERSDVFIYWPVPDWVTEEEMEFYPKSDRIKYLKVPQAKDRIRAYITMSPEFEEILAFNGKTFDFDVLVTVRTGLSPTMRLHMNSPRDYGMSWLKEVWVLEEMPMLKFKQTVPVMVPGVHDRHTIEGYLGADKVCIVSYHEKAGILRAAREYFAPSQVMKLAKKIENVVTASFTEFELKKPEYFFDPEVEQPFGLGYIGRMEKANNLEDINDLMVRACILRGDNVKPIVCTVSRVTRTFNEDWVDVRFPPREEFWEIAQKELHAFVKMPKGGGFSLSLIEPIMLGTPVIAQRSEAYESLLGKDYPFLASGPKQAYGFFKALYDDYEGTYAYFEKWFKEWFVPTYEKRFAEDQLYPKLLAGLDDYEAKIAANSKRLAGLKDNKIVQMLAQHMAGKDMTLFQAIEELGAEGELDVLAQKIEDDDRLSRSIAFSTAFNQIRIGMKLHYGFVDASAEPGHLVKK